MATKFQVYGAATIRVMFRDRDIAPADTVFEDLGLSISGVHYTIFPRYLPVHADSMGGRGSTPRDLITLASDAAIRIELSKYDQTVLETLENMLPGIGGASAEPGTLLFGGWTPTYVPNNDGGGSVKYRRGYFRLLIEAKNGQYVNFPTAIVTSVEGYRGSQAATAQVMFAAYRRRFNGTNDYGEASTNLAVLMNRKKEREDTAEPKLV